MFLLDSFNEGATTGSFCADTANVWQVLGIILTIFKIVIPLLIIIFGMIDLGKAVVASKDDEIKKAIKSLALRAVAGIVIFFIPTLVRVIFGMVSGFESDNYEICGACISNPWGNGGDGVSGCATAAEKAWKGEK